MLDRRINLGNPPKDALEEWAQNHCLSAILSGVNTNISQNTTCAMYDISHSCVQKYRNVQLGHIELNGKKFAAPPKI